MSDKFRHQLRKEAKLWQAEGLIDASVYEQLSQRYQFHQLEREASNRFVAVLLGLGGILLGIGAIVFVAANWQAWSRGVKVTLLLSLFVLVNGAGFYLWRYPKEQWQHRLGQGLLLLGALVLGANLGLMSQMFHLSGAVYELFLAWGLGVLAMAYSLRMTALGVMATILMAIAYGSGLSELFTPGEESVLRLFLEHIPLVAALCLIPLAYWCQSQGIFALSILVLVIALSLNLGTVPIMGLQGAWQSAIAVTLPPALLWGYDDIRFPKVEQRLFQPFARTLAIIFLSILLYWYSFYGWWEIYASGTTPTNRMETRFLILDVVFFAALTLWEWVNLARPNRRHPQRWGVDLTSGVILGLIGVTGCVVLWHLQVNAIPAIATFIVNVQLFLLAAGLIRLGLVKGRRASFWGGMVLLTLQVISRLLEYDTDLLLKSFVFVLCGIGVIAAGLWFERHLAKLAPSQEE